ncbi:hypothetical protein BXY66_3810 [Shimia isoporae]|uniref:Uncharacterized protein n=1 Tax=Shimia isoporae TaxID=647720 RepID=A0A4R1N7P4_9RHOB|nr:hypothetical protein BXY66_3810 [Shimia isoporae]
MLALRPAALIPGLVNYFFGGFFGEGGFGLGAGPTPVSLFIDPEPLFPLVGGGAGLFAIFFL